MFSMTPHHFWICHLSLTISGSRVGQRGHGHPGGWKVPLLIEGPNLPPPGQNFLYPPMLTFQRTSSSIYCVQFKHVRTPISLFSISQGVIGLNCCRDLKGCSSYSLVDEELL